MSTKEAKRTPARQALAEAIERRERAQSELTDTRAAAEKARGELYAARHRVDELKEEAARQDVGRVAQSAVLDVLRRGGDVAELEHAQNEMQERIAAAAREVETWRRAVEIADTEAREREHSLEQYVDYNLDHSARAVISESGVLDRLLAEFAPLHEEVTRRRAELNWLNSRLEPQERRSIPSAPDMFASNIAGSSVWEAALAALKSDADVELPI